MVIYTDEQLLGETKEGLVTLIRNLEEELKIATQRISKMDDELYESFEAMRSLRDAQQAIDKLLDGEQE